MNIQKWGLRLSCLLLALILCFNMLANPLKADATGTGVELIPFVAPIVGIPLEEAITALLLGLGVSAAEDAGAFDSFRETISSSLDPEYTFYADSGELMLKALAIGESYYLAQDLVSGTLSSVHSSGSLALSYSVTGVDTDSITLYGLPLSSWANSINVNAWGRSYVAIGYMYINGRYNPRLVYFDDYPSLAYNSAGTTVTLTSTYDAKSFYFGTSSSTEAYPIGYSQTHSAGSGVTFYLDQMELAIMPVTPIYTSSVLSIGTLAGSLASAAYADWAVGAISTPADPDNPDQETTLYYPLGTSGLADAGTASQPDVWSGTAAIVSPGSIVDTDEDVIVAVSPGNLPDSDTNTDADISTVVRILGAIFALLNPLGNTLSGMTNLLENIKEFFSEFTIRYATWGTTLKESLATSFSPITDTMWAAAQFIVDGIADVLASIFVPSADFVTAKVETLYSKFGYLEGMFGTMESFRMALATPGTAPPVIYVDLGAAEGSLAWGGRVKFLDLTWYERYKPTVDTIMSGFLWAAFLWRLFMHASAYIRGEPVDAPISPNTSGYTPIARTDQPRLGTKGGSTTIGGKRYDF